MKHVSAELSDRRMDNRYNIKILFPSPLLQLRESCVLVLDAKYNNVKQSCTLLAQALFNQYTKGLADLLCHAIV